MREKWKTLGIESSGQIALVLDASESAQPYWPEIKQLAQTLVQRLSGRERCQVFFFGNPQAHDTKDFSTQSESWYQANHRRASLITPVYEALKENAEIKIVALGAGPIFDLEDWLDTPILTRTRFVVFGDTTLTGDLWAECNPELQPLQELLGWLDNAIMDIAIGGPGVMPFRWDNAAYFWDGDRLRAQTLSLRGHTDKDFGSGQPENTPESYRALTIRAGFLCADEAEPQAMIIRYTGDIQVCTLDSTEPFDELLETCDEWSILTDLEAGTFALCVEDGHYPCPICAKAHDAQDLRCPEDAARRKAPGKLVYPSLEQAGLRGLILLRDRGYQVEFCAYPGPMLRLGESIAVFADRMTYPELYGLIAGTWHKTGDRLSPYLKVDANIYAIFL